MTPEETNGMSNKDLLIEQRGMLTHIAEQLGVVQRDLAVHISLPIHPGAAQRLCAMEAEQAAQRAYINKAIGVVAVCLAVGLPIALSLLGK